MSVGSMTPLQKLGTPIGAGDATHFVRPGTLSGRDGMESIWSTRTKNTVKELLPKVSLWPLARPLLEWKQALPEMPWLPGNLAVSFS